MKYRCKLCNKTIETEGVVKMELYLHLVEEHHDVIAPRIAEIAAIAVAEKLTKYVESLFEEV